MKRLGPIAILFSLLSLSACGSRTYHRVQAGDTIFRIGKSYGVSIDRLIAANHLEDATKLEVGQELLIPEASEGDTRPANPASKASVSTKPRAGETQPPGSLASKKERANLALQWPVAGGVVTSKFGARNGSQHDGIDVSAPAGAAVLAAQDGEVLFSNALRGYGNLIILRHQGGFSTVYANNQANLVRQGQRVRRGDIIARVGKGAHADGASLHFEVRRGNVARNPLPYLPANDQVATRASGRDG